MKNTNINNFLKKFAYILPNHMFISSWSACSTARISEIRHLAEDHIFPLLDSRTSRRSKKTGTDQSLAAV